MACNRTALAFIGKNSQAGTLKISRHVTTEEEAITSKPVRVEDTKKP
jgi:hypothetical protein